jgi:hypothetical protein
MCRGDMEHPNLSQGNLVMDEVNVNLYVLRAMTVDRISSHIDSANIIVVHDSRRSNRCVELLKKLTKPTTLGDSMRNRAVLSLSAGTRHCRLALG